MGRLEDEYARLKALTQKLPPMTTTQREEQALDFAYGQLAASTRHKPSKEAFKVLALERGWTDERFKAWADQRAWWMGRMRMEVPARTPIRLTAIRAHSNDVNGGEPKGGYTCDACGACGARFTCAFVFDGYNTNGDCLAEK